MESLNKLFTEDQINDASTKILKSSISKITTELQGNFSREMESWIYEHYVNSKSKIENDLIREITEDFVANPKQYKYSKLREKLFLENKELLIILLTDEAIEKSISSIIWQHTNEADLFNWKWIDGILRIIGENWHKFKDDERVNNGLLRQIEGLKSQISILNQRLYEINNLTENTEKSD